MVLNKRQPALRSRLPLLLLLIVLPACGTITQLFGQATPTPEPPLEITLPPGPEVPTAEGQAAEVTPTPASSRPAAGTVLFEGSKPLNALEAAPLAGEFSVEGMQVLRIDVSVTGGDLLYEFILEDSQGQQLLSLRNDSPSGPAAVNEITLPFTGAYRLRVAPLNGTGEALVRVVAMDGASGGGRVDTLGAPYQGQFAAANVWHAYELDLDAGQPVTLGAYAPENGQPDTRLSFYGPDGLLIAATDDINPPGDLNAVVRDFVPVQGGRYVVMVNAANASNGAYNFIVEGGVAAPQNPADLIFGQVYSATFIDGSVLSATFDGAIGDALRIEVLEASEDLDVDIRVRSPYDTVLAFSINDSEGPGDDQILNEMQLPYTGRFTLELIPNGSGDAQFSIVRLEQAVLTGGGRFAAGPNSSLVGIIGQGSTFHYYQFDASAGERVSIRVGTSNTTGTFDLGFALLNPDGTQLAFADDSGTSNDPALGNYTLSQTGTYTVVVYALTSGTGQYQITLTR